MIPAYHRLAGAAGVCGVTRMNCRVMCVLCGRTHALTVRGRHAAGDVVKLDRCRGGGRHAPCHSIRYTVTATAPVCPRCGNDSKWADHAEGPYRECVRCGHVDQYAGAAP